ncbi:MAG: polysaccharide biosynthesis/export family protein [Kiritimatiellae bacterium]|nr:polysaccharide biosynthesis/export family protein [Kiritimatiellia bacterium]MBR4251134.1 polysaccharide biosynthesis/export family protein [Kiritimatiellia bacterium]
MNGKKALAWAALGLAMAMGIGSGCVDNRPRFNARLLGEGGEEPAFFSDDESVSQVLATKELLKLQSQEYQVGPDDVLDVSVFEWETNDQTKTLQFRVSETGIIALPMVGALNVAGMSVQEIQAAIETALKEGGVLQNPRVGVWVSEFRSRQISVIGSVHQPGSYAIHQNVSTLLDMISLAGGPLDNAGSIAYVIRNSGKGKTPERIKIDLDELLQRGQSDLNPVLGAGDVVFVPKAPLIYVYGSVRQAGAFTFRKQLRVLESIALAGGFTDMASATDVTLIRRLENGGERAYTIDVTRIEAGKDPNIFMRDGDVLRVHDSPPKRLWDEITTLVRGLFSFSYRLNP